MLVRQHDNTLDYEMKVHENGYFKKKANWWLRRKGNNFPGMSLRLKIFWSLTMKYDIYVMAMLSLT